MSVTKITQDVRNKINNTILNQNIKININDYKVGDSIMFSYQFKKIHIKNTGIIIRIRNKSNNKFIQVYNKIDKFICKLNLIQTTLKISKLSKNYVNPHKSHLNHIINK